MLVQVYNLSTSGVRQDLQVSLSYTVSSTRARATYHLNQQKRRVAERDGGQRKNNRGEDIKVHPIHISICQ